MLHQDGLTHEWVPGQHWDLINHPRRCDHAARLDVLRRGGRYRIEFPGHGRGHRAPGAALEPVYRPRLARLDHARGPGGKVGRDNPTQFARAMRQLGVERIPADSPEARGRCERMFNTHQERLPKGARRTRHRHDARGQPLSRRALPRGVQRGVRGAGDRARHRVRVLHRPWARRHRVRAPPAHRRAGQLRELRAQTFADSRSGPSLPLPPWRGYGCIATPTGAWRCSTDRASSPSTSAMVPW